MIRNWLTCIAKKIIFFMVIAALTHGSLVIHTQRFVFKKETIHFVYAACGLVYLLQCEDTEWWSMVVWCCVRIEGDYSFSKQSTACIAKNWWRDTETVIEFACDYFLFISYHSSVALWSAFVQRTNYICKEIDFVWSKRPKIIYSVRTVTFLKIIGIEECMLPQSTPLV